jgi:hypothetical protein
MEISIFSNGKVMEISIGKITICDRIDEIIDKLEYLEEKKNGNNDAEVKDVLKKRSYSNSNMSSSLCDRCHQPLGSLYWHMKHKDVCLKCAGLKD